MPQPRRRRFPTFSLVRRDSGVSWWVFGGPILKSPLSVTRALDDWIRLNDEPREPDGKYHPSSFWMCLREAMYGVRGADQTNPPTIESERTFWLGHAIHEDVQAALGVSPDIAEFYPEFSVDVPELNLRGHGDGLAILPDGRAVMLEAKSAKDGSFRRGLNDHHVQQARTYAVAVRDFGVYVDDDIAGGRSFLNTTDPGASYPNGGDISSNRFIEPLGDRLIGILVFYLNKNESTTREHFIEYDSVVRGGIESVVPGSWRKELEERIEEADAYRLDPDSLPPRLPLVKGKKPWKCQPRWCSVYDLCMSEPAEGREPAGVEVAPW